MQIRKEISWKKESIKGRGKKKKRGKTEERKQIREERIENEEEREERGKIWRCFHGTIPSPLRNIDPV